MPNKTYQKRWNKYRYDPKSIEPFRISRTKVELYLDCPRCFYLNQRFGIKAPFGPPFTLNTAVDTLLKKEFAKVIKHSLISTLRSKTKLLSLLHVII